jgi:hypothetical protein
MKPLQLICSYIFVHKGSFNSSIMGLYHFNWQGKERTVAIYQGTQELLLNFIDAEIIEKVGSRISLKKGSNEASLRLKEIFDSINNAAGQFLEEYNIFYR